MLQDGHDVIATLHLCNY